MDKYWALSQDPATRPVSREVGLPAVASFLDRVGRLLTNPGHGQAELSEKQAKFEGKLRSAMEKGWKGLMPAPPTELPEEKKGSDWTDKLDAQPMLLADSAGRAVVGAKRQAQEKHLEVGARVVAKRKRLGGKEPEAGLSLIKRSSRTAHAPGSQLAFAPSC